MDQYECTIPATFQLNGNVSNGVLSFSWMPSTGLSNPNALNTNATVSQPTSYILSAKSIDYSKNLVVNGDFSKGNTGFFTDYTYKANPMLPFNELIESFYTIGSVPAPMHINWQPCGDHTTGNGNMMLLNGYEAANKNAWCETVKVIPNTEYAFSVWVASVDPHMPPEITFLINGKMVGTSNIALSTTCIWRNFFILWNSGANSTATICIQDVNIVMMGNDFAIDDVVFAPTCTVSDTVTVIPSFPPMPVISGTKHLCLGTSDTIQVDGGPFNKIVWQTGETTSSIRIHEAKSYSVTVTDNANCTATATTKITSDSIDVNAGFDIMICSGKDTLLQATSKSPGATFTWSNGVTTQSNLVNPDTTTTYIVTAINGNGCIKTDSVIVFVIPNPIAVVNDITICKGNTADLIASGGNTYFWSTGASGSTIKVSPATSSSYTVTVSNGSCSSLDTAQVIVLNSIAVTHDIAICEGEKVLIASHIYTLEGTYLDTLQTFQNCDSIITTSIVFKKSARTFNPQFICKGEQVQVGIHTYFKEGMYSDTLQTYQGCDSIIMTSVTFKKTASTSNPQFICKGEHILVGTHSYTNEGVYLDTLQTFQACDSIITTSITFKKSANKFNPQFICKGEQVQVGIHTYFKEGMYSDTLQTYQGCDSIIMTSVTFKTSSNTFNPQFICKGTKVQVGIHSYSNEGMYADTLRNYEGCDSIVNTILSFFPTSVTSNSKTICSGEQLIVGNSIYTQSGTYKDTFKTISGCDSIIITDLIVNKPYYVNNSIALCKGEKWKVGSHSYETAGIYLDTLKSAKGCDSIINTNLEISHPLVSNQSQVICKGEVYHIGNHDYNLDGVYYDTLKTFIGCDSIIITQILVSKLMIMASDDIEIALGESVKLHSNLIYNTSAQNIIYHWIPSTGLSCNFCQDPIATPSNNTLFIVDAVNEYGCTSSDSVLVNVYGIYIPNIFSPNGDGINDFFEVFPIGFTVKETQLFDRWGELVFYNNTQEPHWDGTLKGQKLAPAVFVYLVKGITNSGRELKLKGNITLIR